MPDSVGSDGEGSGFSEIHRVGNHMGVRRRSSYVLCVATIQVDANTMLHAYKAMVQDFAPSDQRALFHDNAARIYRIGGGAKL